MYKIENIDKRKKVLETPLAFSCFNNEKLELVEICMKQNESIPMHKNPVHVVFYVIEGEGSLRIGEESWVLKKGEVVEISPEEDRSWSNPFREDLKLLVMKLW